MRVRERSSGFRGVVSGSEREELRLFLECLLEKTGDETDWVKRKEIYEHIFKHEEELWFKMEKTPLKPRVEFKKVRAAKLLFAQPSPYQSRSTPLHLTFRHMLRSAVRS